MLKTTQTSEPTDTEKEVATVNRKMLVKALLIRVAVPALIVVGAQIATTVIVNKLSSKSETEA
jgi:hypothetical protein